MGIMNMTEFLTAALVALTGIYAFLTYRILRTNEAVVAAMRAEREATMRPYVTISTFTLPHDTRIFLRVENTGRTAARTLRLAMDRSFHSYADPSARFDIKSYPAFTQPIESLGPGMRLGFTLTTGTDLFGEKPADPALVPPLFHVRAQYEWENGVADESSTIDLRPYARTNIESEPVVSELEKIREAIEKKRS